MLQNKSQIGLQPDLPSGRRSGHAQLAIAPPPCTYSYGLVESVPAEHEPRLQCLSLQSLLLLGSCQEAATHMIHIYWRGGGGGGGGGSYGQYTSSRSYGVSSLYTFTTYFYSTGTINVQHVVQCSTKFRFITM